jgi:hypothetical protein
MLSAVLGALSGLGKIVGAVWQAIKVGMIFEAGKNAATKEARDKRQEITDAQLEIANEPLPDIDDVDDSMRDGEF